MAEPTLFDEASLALIASGGAGKDGKVYSVKPVPVYGAEEVTNGDFATDSDWTKASNWTISGGKAVADGSSQGALIQNIAASVIGKKYKISFTISNYNSGDIRMYYGGQFTSYASRNGVHSATITATSADTTFMTSINTAFNGYIDNVSVKEVLVEDGDFTFSRGSNLAATRVGADGLIEKGRENLLLQSNQFDTTWTGAGPVSGQEGYNGSNDAWKITKTNLYTYCAQQVTNSGVGTFSVYAKAGTYNYLLMHIEDSSGDCLANFNLSTGTLGSLSSGITSKIESVGTNGWYRCSATFNKNVTDVRFFPSESGGYTGTSGSIYIQDAQLEIGLAATDYIESGATTGKAGLLEDEPRFDYSGGATCPSLLLEPSRTNLVPYSEYFEILNQTYTDLSISPDLSPEGVYNAMRAEWVTGSQIGQSFAITSGLDYTTSIYAKSVSGTSQIQILNMQGNPTTFDITSEWARYDLTDASTSTTGRAYVRLLNIGDIVDFYGLQCEQGSYPTSYIPNHSGGSVTRGEDSCVDGGSAESINSTEGVLYAEISALANADVNRKISLNDGTSNNSVVMFYYTLSDYIFFQIYKAGTRVLNLNVSYVDKSILHKIAFKYKNSDYSVWIDGVEVLTDSLADNIPANTLNKLSFDGGVGAYPFNGNVKQVLVFKEALSDTELIKLTTI